MKLKFWPVLLLMSAGSVAWAQGAKPVPACGERPPLFASQNRPLSEKDLPDAIFVARVAEVWIESKDGQLKLHARHNFKTGQKEFLCADFPGQQQGNFSIPIAALLDRTVHKKTGDALWQFQIMVNGSRLGLWNRKSGLLNVNDVLFIPNSPWKVEFSSGDLEGYSLRVLSDSAETMMSAVIRYDLVEETSSPQ